MSVVRKTIIFLLALLLPLLVGSAEPPAEPILRIETEMHTNIIRRISLDAQNRYLAASSEYKTVRIFCPQPVTVVKALVDERPAAITGKEDVTGQLRIRVPIPARDVEIGIIAENAHGAGEPAALSLAWAGRMTEAFVIKPKLYVLAVGVKELTGGKQTPTTTKPQTIPDFPIAVW